MRNPEMIIKTLQKSDTMIIEHFITLPPYINYQKVCFELCLMLDMENGPARLYYKILFAYPESPHYETIKKSGGSIWVNPFFDNLPQRELWKSDNITTDDHLLNAIFRCKAFLHKNKLSLADGTLPNGFV